MNILFVTCWYPIEVDPRFGIFVHEHARAVAGRGAKVRILHVWPLKDRMLYKKEYSIVEKDGIKVHQLLLHSSVDGFFYNFWPTLQHGAEEILNKEILPEFSPDLLHGNVVYPAGFITRHLAGNLNLPYVLTEHWSKLDWVFGRPIYRSKAEKVFREAASVHPVSKVLKQQVENKVSGIKKMSVIPNVVDPELFYYEEHTGDSGKIKLLCVTNFFDKDESERDKRPDLLLEAYFNLEKKLQSKLLLRFVGPGRLISHYQQEVSLRGLQQNVFFEGAKEKDYVAEKMKKSDYLLHPSERETFGVVVAEALSCGLPCIVSDIPALTEKVTVDSGLVVPENSVEAWKGALRKIALNRVDFNRKQIASDIGENYSYRSVGLDYMEAYKQALE